jgi:hypothetical protein
MEAALEEIQTDGSSIPAIPKNMGFHIQVYSLS